MKIKFTVFNDGQEHYEFDTDSLAQGEELDKFIINRDDRGIYIFPMIIKDKCMKYGGEILENTETRNL
jgi:hypothetical protein